MSKLGRLISACLILVSMTMSGVVLQSGCTGDVSDTFRAAATDSLASGLKTVTNGLIDGLFALFYPDSGAASAEGAASASD